jgi:tetratricopeptide (TPR) repeat protein
MRISSPSIAGTWLALVACTYITGCAAPGSQSTSSEQTAEWIDPAAAIAEADAAIERKEYLRGAQIYLKAAEASSDEIVAEQATRAAYEHQQWSIALAAANRWLKLNSTSEDGQRFGGFAALRLYQLDEATEHLETLINSAYINPQAGFLALAPELSQEGTNAAVTEVFKRLVEKFPTLAEAHYALAQAALESGNLALGLTHAQRAYEIAPYWSPGGLLLARAQLVNNQTEAGLATAREVVKRDTKDEVRLEYAVLLLAAGDEAGRTEIAKLAAKEGTAAAADRTLALMDLQAGNRDQAVQRFSELVSRGRFVFESLYYLGLIAEGRDAPEEALQFYSRVTGGQFAMTAQIRAARLRVKSEGVAKGIASLEEFGSARPEYVIDAVTARAALLADSGDSKAALKLLEDTLAQYPDSQELRFARVFQLEKDGRVKDSINGLEMLVKDRPGDPIALNALGYTLVDRTRRQEEGLKLISQALAQTPDNGAVLDSMGWALFRTGKKEEALKYLEQAQKRIQDPEVDLHVGEVLLSLGRRDEALKVLEAAAKAYPDDERLKKRLAALNR